jgi:hypothetical protein
LGAGHIGLITCSQIFAAEIRNDRPCAIIVGAG